MLNVNIKRSRELTKIGIFLYRDVKLQDNENMVFPISPCKIVSKLEYSFGCMGG